MHYASGAVVPVRRIASLTGKLMAAHIAIGNVARRMTRACYAWIASLTGVPPDAPKRVLKIAWNIKAAIPSDVASELQFWLKNLPNVVEAYIKPKKETASVVLSADASDFALGGFLETSNGERLIMHDILTVAERESSSTSRELIGTLRAMLAFESKLAAIASKLHKLNVIAYCDNQSAVRILEVGSKRPGLQSIARRIFALEVKHNIRLFARWQRRNTADQQFCDDGSKFIDTADFQLMPDVFHSIERDWAVRHDADQFASSANAQACDAFRSRFYCPDARNGSVNVGVDAFAFDWHEEDSWLHPPFCQIARCYSHLKACRGKGTMVVPLRTRQPWWPLLRNGADGVVHRKRLRRQTGLLRKHGMIPSPAGPHDLMVVRLDFSELSVSRRRSSLKSRLAENLQKRVNGGYKE